MITSDDIINLSFEVSCLIKPFQVCMGYGFAWLPEEHICDELRTGMLRPLPLREGGTREVSLYLILANPDFAGPGVRRLAEIIKESVGSEYVF